MNPLDHLKVYDIYLGSASPRRKELFSKFEVPFEIIKSDVEEIIPPGLPAEEAPEYLSMLKSDDLVQKLSGEYMLITTDTVVIFGDEILGKPKDLQEAKAMLDKLQGKKHNVISGVTIRTNDKTLSFSALTEVKMSAMTPGEISWYAENFEVMDKAGAYGIQDWIGLCKIEDLMGSYYNVMGLPTDQLYEHLIRWK